MSTEIRTVPTYRGPLALIQFAGPFTDPWHDHTCLQLTQGTGGGPDRPGFIQLSREDAGRLIPALQDWIIQTGDGPNFPAA